LLSALQAIYAEIGSTQKKMANATELK
jgi:hypothetical protein